MSRFALPPKALRRRGVTLDNLTLVPASLLPFKARYTKLATSLPRGTVLLVLPRRHPNQRRLLVELASRFAKRGHQIAMRTIEEVLRL
jgi:hypothetical protein